MDIGEFRGSLKDEKPPEGFSAALEALWWDGKGSWEKAHEAAQRDEGAGWLVGTCLSASQGRRFAQRQVLVPQGRPGSGVWGLRARVGIDRDLAVEEEQ